jgi:hypothetical protein
MRIRTTMPIVPMLLSGALLFVVSCQKPSGQASSPTNRAEEQQVVEKREPALDQALKKREARLQELKAMDVPQLAAELEKESLKGREPFNSLTYAETVSRGEGAAAALAPLITKPNRASLFALLALRKISAGGYKNLKPEFRVSVLVDSLRTAKYFNTFGLPHVRWEDAAKAIIEEGRAAEPALVELLSDKRDAPVWGSEDFAEYQRYKYRVCDYAWALLNEIRGTKVEIPEDPAARDRLQAESNKPK